MQHKIEYMERYIWMLSILDLTFSKGQLHIYQREVGKETQVDKYLTILYNCKFDILSTNSNEQHLGIKYHDYSI